MRTAIPKLSQLVKLLHDLLEFQYTKHKTRKKSRVANRPISEWEDKHNDAFSSLITAIAEQVTLTIPHYKKRLCLFTDTFSTHWAGVLTQVEPKEVTKSKILPQNWNHSPISFVSGTFRGVSSLRSTPDQESYAIVASVTGLSHILAACGEFSRFSDHKNILYLLSPARFNANVARHVVHKTQRWALQLAEFNFTVEHIPG